ncbi:MAG: hypothetical protein NC177_02165 [Ruminococcus flavefaciens]|nr:hypothetical protein [Ruminococcus flavefaciens]
MNKIILSAVFILFGCGVMGIPAFFSGRLLYQNIMIFRKGEKFSGTCTGYKFERWNCGYDVYWNDGSRKLHGRFDVPIIRFKYPFAVDVYSMNHATNLGMFTIIKNILCFAVCALLWIACTGITLNDIYNLFIY